MDALQVTGFHQVTFSLTEVVMFFPVLFSTALCQTCSDHAGKEFMVVPVPVAMAGQVYQIHVTSARPTTKEITARLRNPLLIFPSSSMVDTTFIIQPNKHAVAKITNYVTVMTNEKNNAALVLTSDHDVIVYTTISKPESIGSMVLLPLATLGIRYVALTHTPNPSSTDRAILIIGAAYDETEVTITFRGDPLLNIDLSDTTYRHSDQFSIKFSKKYENYVMFVSYDITGTTIEGTKPIAVFSGNKALSLNNDGIEDLAFEQLSPVAIWGDTYIVMSNPEVERDVLKVVTTATNTHVYVNDTLYTLEKRGDFIQIPLLWDNSRYVTVNSSSSIQVAMFGSSSSNSDGLRSDVTMTIIQPFQNFVDNYVFMTAAAKLNFQHYLVVFSQNGFTSTISLDGSSLPDSWESIENKNSAIDYKGTITQITTEGCHTLKDSDGHAFSGYVYGIKDKESYGAGLASVMKTTWNVDDPIVTAKFTKKMLDQLPFPDPFLEQKAHKTLDCYKTCSRHEHCGVVGTIKMSNAFLCKFYEVEAGFGPFQKAEGYKLYVRDRNIA